MQRNGSCFNSEGSCGRPTSSLVKKGKSISGNLTSQGYWITHDISKRRILVIIVQKIYKPYEMCLDQWIIRGEKLSWASPLKVEKVTIGKLCHNVVWVIEKRFAIFEIDYWISTIENYLNIWKQFFNAPFFKIWDHHAIKRRAKPK